MDIETIQVLREFFGWCTFINVVIMVITVIAFTALKGWPARIHAKMFGLDETVVRKGYFEYLSIFKIAVMIFNLVPYLALVLMERQ